MVVKEGGGDNIRKASDEAFILRSGFTYHIHTHRNYAKSCWKLLRLGHTKSVYEKVG